MARKTFDKCPVAADVYALALDRTRTCFAQFDKVAVMFSGGKDSTACLNLALAAAREIGRTPLEVVFYDEEAIPPETVEYVARVAALPDVKMRWLCLPTEQRNACSRRSPHWYPWAEEDRHLWVRDLPDAPGVTTELAGFRRQTIPDCAALVSPPVQGRVCHILGIRCQESLTRFQSIVSKRGDTAFLQDGGDFRHITKAYPIYDWTTDDVWLAPELHGWDYNRAYDVMAQLGVTLSQQRCSPAFGEQPLRRLWTYKLCWPGLWAKMTRRVPGAATAARYANTELYGIGPVELPDGVACWRDRVYEGLLKLPAPQRRELSRVLAGEIRHHYRYTDDPPPDAEPHSKSGYCWKTFFPMVAAGDNKLGRQGQRISAKARKFRMTNGIMCVEDARRAPA